MLMMSGFQYGLGTCECSPQHLLRLVRVDSELTAMNPVAFDVANGNLQLAVTSISF
jgi:hypothetical protein